ncbi:RNA 2',3'-cyclic phosphodiesterase [Alteraurantiacibacter aestuarii]|uniref:RNA 2',3'-cyclic phosphodiesterase n=1 Tax=Alteraurantiacibacter aestuarii TaxID=650004 RepID=A0A844ZLR2_9SPHN|nr:RNA 2',3'-cyclic phosphodiesterase [Alteraurantiacibacter aestuarii]MXO87777.1 RNA 2',3'-cyclic phosphodiesterase [Alteraurantiacibacter aestuarii]
MSHRLFIAIRPPVAVIDSLIDTMEGLDNARWQSEEQLHLTLRFVGEVERPQAEDLALALAQIRFAPFAISIAGVGHFETKGAPRTLWARVEPSRDLSDLQKRVEQACRAAGLEDETRKFVPHITLARLDRSAAGIGAWLARHARLHAPPFIAENFVLVESHLSTGGSIYQDVMRFPS